jgi:hypothetical protein
MKTRFSSNLQWMTVFLPLARKYVNIDQIRAIKGYKIPLSKNPDQDAGCTYCGDGTYIITISTHKHEIKTRLKTRNKYKYTTRTLYEMLDDLAHELAHIPTWRKRAPHPPRQMNFTGRLMAQFAHKLELFGIKDTWVPFTRFEKILKKQSL